MGILRGTFRMATFLALLLVLTPSVIILSYLPFLKWRGASVAAWLITLSCRVVLKLFDVQVDCDEPERICRHNGLIFPNHVSYLDVLIMMHFAPMRFLAKKAVENWLFIGQMGKAVGSVFVKRNDKASRQAARQKLKQVPMPPSLIIFPEGRTGPGATLLPFRYGAFDIAIQTGKPYLPCPIIYDREALVVWGEEHLLKAAWRLASRAGRVHARVVPLKPVKPKATDSAQQLSLQTHADMLAKLPYEKVSLPS